MSPHQQSPRLRQLQQQLGGGPPLRSRNGGSPRQNGGGARVGDVIQAPQVRTIKMMFSRVILEEIKSLHTFALNFCQCFSPMVQDPQ